LASYDVFLFPQAQYHTEGGIISELHGDTNEHGIELQAIRIRPTSHALGSAGIAEVTEYTL
jgi:hypothetical protein